MINLEFWILERKNGFKPVIGYGHKGRAQKIREGDTCQVEPGAQESRCRCRRTPKVGPARRETHAIFKKKKKKMDCR